VFAWCTLFFAALGSIQCGGGDPEPPAKVAPGFPSDYETSYTEVRNCRASADHNLRNIRILADEAALDAYDARDSDFPEGAVVLKEEYEIGDDDCSGPIEAWTVMIRLAEGSSDGTLDWRWQQLDADREVTDVDLPRCIGCHQGCGVPPDGYQGTCAVP
jgi:hypothetical protein